MTPRSIRPAAEREAKKLEGKRLPTGATAAQHDEAALAMAASYEDDAAIHDDWNAPENRAATDQTRQRVDQRAFAALQAKAVAAQLTGSLEPDAAFEESPCLSPSDQAPHRRAPEFCKSVTASW